MRGTTTDARWIVSTNRGDEMRARFVCMANGPLHRPKLPGIPGIETFEGHTFHTSRWDYDYTGGDTDGGPRPGWPTSASASSAPAPPPCSACPTSAPAPSSSTSSSARRRRSTSATTGPPIPEWAASLEPGWQQRRMENFNNLVSGVPEPEDLVDDGWTDIIGKLLLQMRQADGHATLSPEGLAKTIELADFEKMEQIRARVDAIVEDPATAEALKPYYRQFCKRPCFHDEYLDTFNRPNVTLVDTAGPGRRADHRARRRRRRRRVRARLPRSTPPASRSAPTTPAAPATRSSAATA